MLLVLLWKKEIIFTMKSTISVGESLEMLLVTQKITQFSSNRGIDKSMAHQSIFFAHSPPNMFNGPKYPFQPFEYMERHAIM